MRRRKFTQGDLVKLVDTRDVYFINKIAIVLDQNSYNATSIMILHDHTVYWFNHCYLKLIAKSRV